MSCSADPKVNLDNAKRLVREAASKGAQVILLQELFHTLYFCQVWSPFCFAINLRYV
jgi:N-carbamoylputrescine amidase